MELRLKNLKYSFRCLGLIIKEHPSFLVCGIISTICLVLEHLVPINIVAQIIELFQNRDNYEKPFNEIIKIIIINISIMIISGIIYQIIDYFKYYIQSHFSLTFSTVLFKKLESIDYEFHQNAQFLDNYTRALDGGAEKIYAVANNQMSLISSIIDALFILSIILSVHYLAMVYAMVVAGIYMLIRRKSGEMQFDKQSADRPFVRLEWAISRMYFVKDSIPDIKTTNINNVMLDEHTELNKERIKVYDKYTTKKTVLDTIGSILLASIYPIILLIVCYVAIENKDLSSLASLTVAATSISNSINSIIVILTQIQIEALEAKVSFEVLDMESKIEGRGGDKIEGKFEMLSINNISFAYGDKVVLNDISLHIKNGEKIAIVGSNGAGKTTFVKLLLRLYDVKKGSIFFNNNMYTDTDPKEIRGRIGAVFQNPEVYSVSIAENILLRKIESKEDIDLVIEALKFADIYDYVMSLPEGLNTIVTREFSREGAIFSGGQTQKIAVARGYAQNYEILLLDEPSSKLDPLAETKMINNMLSLGKDKTLIFISHRLSATCNCDRIYLFEDGIIKEFGTHEELMKLEKGKYREMFISQAEKYIGGNND